MCATPRRSRCVPVEALQFGHTVKDQSTTLVKVLRLTLNLTYKPTPVPTLNPRQLYGGCGRVSPALAFFARDGDGCFEYPAVRAAKSAPNSTRRFRPFSGLAAGKGT